MSSKDLVSINIDKEMIEPIVQAHIQAAIVSELRKDDNLVYKMVEAAMAEKVSYNGTKSQYSSDNKYLYIERLCSNAIQEASKKAIKEHVNENYEKIKEEIKKALSKRNKEIATQFVDALVNRTKEGYTFTCNVDLKVGS